MRRYFEEIAYHQRGGASLVNHRHQNPDSYEIIHVLSGGGSAFIEDRTYELIPGTLLLIDAAGLHCITPADVTGYSRSKLIIDKAYLKGVFAAMGAAEALDAFFTPRAGSCFYLSGEQSIRADGLFYGMTAELETGEEASALRVMSSLMGLFDLCSRSMRHVEPRPGDKLAPVLQYLRAHYAEPLTIEQVASELHMSKYYLCHLCRKQTGLTLMQYLCEQRLSAARQQLTCSDLPISAIAQNCGFGSSSRFCTLFRRREGMSPRDYRRRWAEK